VKFPFFGRKAKPDPEPVPPVVAPPDEAALAREAIKQMLRAYAESGKSEYGMSEQELAVAEADPRIRRVREATGPERGRLATAMLRSHYLTQGLPFRAQDSLTETLKQLTQGPGCMSREAFPDFVDAWLSHGTWHVSDGTVVRLAQGIAETEGLDEPMRAAIQRIVDHIRSSRAYNGPDVPLSGESRKLIQRYERILNPLAPDENPFTEAWQAPFRVERFRALAAHAATARSKTPSDRWLKPAPELIAAVGVSGFLDAFAETVGLVERSKTPVDTLQSDMLRGLCWLCGSTGTPRAAQLLGRMVVACGYKLPGVGARSTKGFTGAVDALERLGNFEALAQLSNARNRVKTVSLATALVSSLERAALKQNLPLEDLEELVVPSFGLELPGVRTDELGDVTARLEISGTADATLRWFKGGKEQKSVPASISESFVAELKELKGLVKEIEQTLGAQVRRVERMMMTGRSLPFEQWQTRYFDHPLLASMVRRLIWRFDSPEGERLGIAPDGELIDLEGRPFAPDASVSVRLWHPIEAGAAVIEAARDFLISRELRQPFKQAFREVYILTDAERTTETYSNRFAGHVLKQHQMRALAGQRGWSYSLQGYFDSCDFPTLDLRQWGLRAAYDVQVPDSGGADMDTVSSPSGIALYVLTDRVTFELIEGVGIVPLRDVPAVVFSEVMRDVDLFVGVCSVGNDPTWVDQGALRGFGAYWQSYSFGDLSATARTRADVLRRLLPRLAIGPFSAIDGKFLVVTGKLRKYKIHLGSGNILMMPNDEYLCIVPGRAKETPSSFVYLPFEGDYTLSVILSKALMLIDDDKITDSTITRQIKKAT